MLNEALDAHHTKLAAVLPTVLIAITALSGCLGGDDPMFGSYEDARSAVGEEVEPTGSDSPIRLGVIEPETPQNVSSGRVDVVVLLFDPEAGQPVQDAAMTLDARMPMHGHGTEPEEDPTHDAHGVYAGWTTLAMGGMWQVHVNATLTDDTELNFLLEVHVMGGDGMDGGMGGGMHGGMGPEAPYDSYEDAQAADGEVFAPADGSDLRLKLLEPSSRSGVETEAPIHVLLFDNASDGPLPDAEASLAAAAVNSDDTAEPEDGLMHTSHGLYVAEIPFPEEGLWELEFEADSDEGAVQWQILVAVGEGNALPEDHEETITDEFGPGEYEGNHTFQVEYTRVLVTLNVSVEGTLGVATGGVEALTVAVSSPSGEEIDSVEVEAGDSELIEIQGVDEPGAFSIDVSGQGGQASYTIELTVDYDL